MPLRKGLNSAAPAAEEDGKSAGCGSREAANSASLPRVPGLRGWGEQVGLPRLPVQP